MAFADKLHELRRAHDLTQEEFAQQLQVSRQAVSKWESGKGYPEIEKILYICNCYGVSMDELFCEELPDLSDPDTKPEPAPAAAMTAPPLKASFGSFFTNLSPYHQAMFATASALLGIVLLVLACISISKGESDQMVMKLIWTGLLVVFVIGEAVTVGLTSIWFVVGGVGGLVASMLGGPIWLQLVVFFVVSVGCMVAARPLVVKYINQNTVATNADRVLGAAARVTEAIDNTVPVGAVYVDGKTWSARSETGEPIAAGAMVRVTRMEGVRLFVEELKEV